MTLRRNSRDAAALIVGTIVSGLAAYAYVMVGTQVFGARDFAPISIVWTVWTFSVAAITFPLQHWVIREIEAGREGQVAANLRFIYVSTVVAALGLMLVTRLVDDRLLRVDGWGYPAIIALVTLGTAVAGVGRGLLAGRRRFVAAGMFIGAENVVRLLAGAIVVWVWPDAIIWFGAALVLGPLVVVFWSGALRPAVRSDGEVARPHIIATAGAGNLVAQAILVGAPVVVTVLGGTRTAITSTFVVLALFRAPYVVALGLLVRVTGPLTRLVEQARLGALRRVVGAAVIATVATSALMAVAGLLVGADLTRVVFGDSIVLERAQAGAAAAGNGIALGALFLTTVLLTRDDGRGLTLAWAGALGAGIVATSLWPGSAVDRALAGFVVAEIGALGMTAWRSARADNTRLLRSANSPLS